MAAAHLGHGTARGARGDAAVNEVVPLSDHQRAVNTAIGRLDAWLDTMRGARGYGGPIADWWRQGFTWTGTALDWRYQGVIAGYIELWRRTGNGHWLAKAQWAGDDLLAGQLPSGRFAHGPWERGSYTAGAPHEAACASALLLLALALRESGSAVWQPYASAAELTIHGTLIGELWDAELGIFRDAPGGQAFLPYQNATICEAMFHQSELRQQAVPIERYVLPALRAIVKQQVRAQGHALDGAIPYRLSGNGQPAKFLPLCVVGCVPALARGYDWTGDPALLEAAWRAFAFVQRWRKGDGSLPAVIYPNGRSNRYPQWIAATGDVIRAAHALRLRGISTNVDQAWCWMLGGQDGSGGIATAHGFGAQVRQQPPRQPDVRDLLHVPGWCAKAFHALALDATDVVPADIQRSEHVCTYRGRLLILREDDTHVEICHGREIRYRWRKGDEWPAICAPEFVLE